MINTYTLEQKDQWDAVVRSFEEYDVYWLSGYVKAFMIHGDGKPILISYDDGKTRGINVVMMRDIAEDSRFVGKLPPKRYYDVVTPYGYGGWIIEGDDTDPLFSEYRDWIENRQIISEFVRFHPLIKNHTRCCDFYEVIQLGEVVHMDLASREAIWENITSKNRNMIRKADKNDIRIYNGRFPVIYKTFRDIYDKTMDKDHAELYYYFKDEFYETILDDLSSNAQVFWAEKDGMPIAASIMLECNGYMNYHLSGSLAEYKSLAPTNLLLYQAAIWGHEHGMRTLYLGGGVGSGEDSLFKFKRAFYKGELNYFYIGKKIYNQGKYDQLAGTRAPSDSSFFPKYRA